MWKVTQSSVSVESKVMLVPSRKKGIIFQRLALHEGLTYSAVLQLNYVITANLSQLYASF